MKQEDLIKIQIELELLKAGFYDDYIDEYLAVTQNVNKLEKDFQSKLYEKTGEFSKRRTKYVIKYKTIRKWWYMQKRPELFDKKLLSKFE